MTAAPAALCEASATGEGALGQRIEALTQAQDLARTRMERLELEIRNLATMEAASKALIAELLLELRAARTSLPPAPGTATSSETPTGLASNLVAGTTAGLAPQAPARHIADPDPALAHPFSSAAQHPDTAKLSVAKTAASEAEPFAHATPAPAEGIAPAASDAPARDAANKTENGAGPTVLTARKIVTLHGPGGPVASYALGREPKPEPHFPEPPAPTSAFLDLPAVIRSDRGDFLGLPGGQSVRRLVEVLTPEGATPPVWFQEAAESWTCAIPLGRAQNRELLFERTTTPRGNLVGLIRRMRINETEATPTQLQEIFRQLRDQFT